MSRLIHRLDVFLRHKRITIGLRWIMVQMWFLKIAGIKYANKSYKTRLLNLVSRLQNLTNTK